MEDLDYSEIASLKTKTKYNGRNYTTWAPEAETLLRQLGLWQYITGIFCVPRPPAAPGASTTPDPLDPNYDFKPPSSTDQAYLYQFNCFLTEWGKYQVKLEVTWGWIYSTLEPSIQSRYREDTLANPKKLWESIKADFEKMIKLNTYNEMEKFTLCKLESYPSVTEWTSAQDAIIRNLAICDVKVNEHLRKFYTLSNLPKSIEWRTFTTALELNDKTDTAANITMHLQSFEVSLRRDKGIAPDAPLFGSKRARGKNNSKGSSVSTYTNSSGQQVKHTCFSCGEKGHKKVKCPNKDKWAS
jgi:hypothetical protein